MTDKDQELRCKHCGKIITEKEAEKYDGYCEQDYYDFEDNDELEDDAGFF
jgi:hypothetical protein